jgi:hypothetical protein
MNGTMRHIMLAFTEPMEGSDEAFNLWYDEVHAPQVLETPGFVAVQRYRLDAQPGMSRGRYRYLAIYEIETTDLRAVQAALADRAGGFTPFAGGIAKPITYFYDPLSERRR